LWADGHGRVLGRSIERAAAAAAPAEDAAEAVAATAARPVENGANVWPDENAEAAFIADARQRGEPVVAAVATREAAEEKEDDKKALPPLADLMKRLAPEVRETLDDLFRAKFTGVRRVPKQCLKTAAG
jgi:phosphoglycolate phosphatase-like HAD superfamily hydrolase